MTPGALLIRTYYLSNLNPFSPQFDYYILHGFITRYAPASLRLLQSHRHSAFVSLVLVILSLTLAKHDDFAALQSPELRSGTYS